MCYTMSDKENKKVIDDESIKTSDTPENVKKTESEVKTKTDAESVKVSDTSQTPESVPKEQFEAVAKNLSTKDKEISSVKKELEQFKNLVTMKDKLLDLDVPASIKQKIKAKLDSGNITLETFDNEVETLKEVYEEGFNSFKNKQNETINNSPTKVDSGNAIQAIKNATSMEELEETWKNRI